MQRSTGHASAGSWQAAVQFHTQLGTAWHRHIAAIAAGIPVGSTSPNSGCLHHGKEASTIESEQELSSSKMVAGPDSVDCF